MSIPGPAVFGALRRWLIRGMAGPVGVPAGPHYAAVIVKLDRLGDFVLARSAIKRVLEKHGPERCLLVVSPFAEKLAAREFPATPRLILPCAQGHWRAWKTAWRQRARVSRIRADVVICLRHQRWDYDEIVLSWFNAGTCVRIEDGFTRRAHPEFRLYDCPAPGGVLPEATPAISARSEVWLCRELEWHRQVIERALGIRIADADILPALATTEVAHGILVAPFGSLTIKNFPVSLLRAALCRARKLIDEPIAFIGEAAQEEGLRRLAAKCSEGANIIAVRAQLPLEEYIAAVGQARLVISTDTATAHLAAAYDRPAVIALGGGHYGQFGPWRRSSRQQWLTQHLDCFGCDWACKFPEPHCLTHIPESAAASAVDHALAGT